MPALDALAEAEPAAAGAWVLARPILTGNSPRPSSISAASRSLLAVSVPVDFVPVRARAS